MSGLVPSRDKHEFQCRKLQLHAYNLDPGMQGSNMLIYDINC